MQKTEMLTMNAENISQPYEHILDHYNTDFPQLEKT